MASFLSNQNCGSSFGAAAATELGSRLFKLVAEIALASKDVVIERDNFSKLAKYLEKIRPILKEFRDKNVTELPIMQIVMQSLEKELKLAKELIEMCSSKSRFYLLINCKNILKQIQDCTNEIGRCLSLIPIANLDISMEMKENTIYLQKSMMNAQFKAALREEEILNKINAGVKGRTVDHEYANEMLLLIAKAVGIPGDPESLKRELEDFKKEKEQAELLKRQSEAVELQQIIAFLSKADAIQSVKKKEEIYQTKKSSLGSQFVPPLQSFFCPLTKEIMEDPVGLASGKTFERSAIENWFSAGNKTCPVTSMHLSTVDLKPNTSLRKTIYEWRERNTRISISNSGRKIRYGNDDEISATLSELQRLIEENPNTREWIGTEGLIPILAYRLTCSKGEIKQEMFSVLLSLAVDNNENKERIAEAGAVQCAVHSLARGPKEGKRAVALLLELSKNANVCQQIGRVQGCILLLVAMVNSGESEATRDSAELLRNLSNDDQNVVQMAECNYFKPLLHCLSEGSEKTKIFMSSALANMELTDQGKGVLGREGAIPPLVNMFLTEKFEAKLLALRALRQLSSLPENAEQMINARLIPHLIQLLFSVTSSVMSLKEPAAAILENFAVANNAFELQGNFFRDFIENENIIGQLLSVLNTTDSIIQGHLLRTLNGIACQSSDGRNRMRESGAIQLLLPFLSGKEIELRVGSLNLLFSLSQDGSGQELAEKLGKKNILILTSLLSESLCDNEKSAILGIISSFPVQDTTITNLIMEANALQTIVSSLKVENTATDTKVSNQLMENAAGALIRFTVPSNKKLQFLVVEYGAMPLLVNLIVHGTYLGKSRAAISLAQLSQNSFALTNRVSKGHSWFCFSPKLESICRVHGGHCSVKTSFCLVEAGAIAPLLQVLDSKDQEANEAALFALSSIVSEENWERAVSLLESYDGILPIISTLTRGSLGNQEKALHILEKVFRREVCRIRYGSRVQFVLIDIAQKGSHSSRSLAGKILGHLELLQNQSSYF